MNFFCVKRYQRLSPPPSLRRALILPSTLLRRVIYPIYKYAYDNSYYTTPVVYFAVGDKVISNGLKSPIYRPQGHGHHSIYGGFQNIYRPQGHGHHSIYGGFQNRWRSLYLQRQNTQQSLYNIVLQLLTVRIRKHTQLSCASLCMLHHTQLSFASWCI